jgi:hypothetical protein
MASNEAEKRDAPESPVSFGNEEKHVVEESDGRPDAPPTNSRGIVLIPRPSEDPRDPLNWPFLKKAFLTGTLALAAFTGWSVPFNGQIQLTQQAQLYHKTTVQITYFVRFSPTLSLFALPEPRTHSCWRTDWA